MKNRFILIIDEFNINRNKELYKILKNHVNCICVRTAEEFVESSNLDNFDLFLILGGDGSFLKAINKLKIYQKPFMGIQGGTVGYYMNTVSSILDINGLLKNHESLLLPELHYYAKDIKGKEIQGSAISDVWVERTMETLRMTITIDDDMMNQKVFGDGMLFSTPVGSTGYTSTLRGKVLPIDLEAYQMVPMSCAIEKRTLKSFIMNQTHTVKISFQDSDYRQGRLMVDGILQENLNPVEFQVSYVPNKVSILIGSIQEFRKKSFSWNFE